MLLAFDVGPTRSFGSLHAVGFIPLFHISLPSYLTFFSRFLSSHFLSYCADLHSLVEVDEVSIAAAFKSVKKMSGIEISAFVQPIMHDWSDAEDLQLLLSPPWDTSAQDILESMLVVLFFRVALALFTLFTGATACVLSLGYYRRQAEWSPGRVICFVQAPMNILQAIWCGSGAGLQSTIFPTNLLSIQYSFYSVATTASTLLVVVRINLSTIVASYFYSTPP